MYAAVAPSNFYELLSIEVGAPTENVKAAYRRLQRITHPDVAGDYSVAISVLLNVAYETLSDPAARVAYDFELKNYQREGGSFDGRPVSTWFGSDDEPRAVFVDETTCIGCRQCTLIAPDTFEMEQLWGRARVAAQWADDGDVIQEAVESCPVDCIYYVRRQQLALLEFVMKLCPREDVALMARRRSGNMGSAPNKNDPFARAQAYLRARQDANVDEVQQAAVRRMQDDALAAALAKAWLQLPPDLRARGWPDWQPAP